MTYASGRDYDDADSHIMELPDFLLEFADPPIRSELPSISYSASAHFRGGGADADDPWRDSVEHKAQRVALGDEMIRGPEEIQALGAFDRADRSQALDMLSFKKQLVFSTPPAAIPLSTRVNTEGRLGR
ncbi:MAG: hypothetical protein O7H39_15165 [Gammaproteobacteria bacterium]|nr:hypothetical protein [Gammaproteobacteria bacterium]